MRSSSTEGEPEPPVVEFRHVSLSFDDKPALVDVSFQLSRGNMICVTGESLSGKSVLLKLSIGLMRADEGQVLVDGRDIGALSEAELLDLRRNSMGVVFQDSSLFTGLSAYENAAYRLTEAGLSDEAVDRGAMEILRFVGLERDADKLPEELSIGMRRRLEFARGLAGWPRIMLFDEPVTGLDPINARNILDLVVRARDVHNVSTILVTKEAWEIRYVSTRRAVKDSSGEVRLVVESRRWPGVEVMLLDSGRIAFHGSPDDFASSTLPEVARMTRGIQGIPDTSARLRDPWSRTRRSSSDGSSPRTVRF
jgi:phospholipid/cholesterol/gamma-HCH transport system ATP-binding protein